MNKHRIYYYFSAIDGFDELPIVLRVLDSHYKSAFIKVINKLNIFDQVTFVGCHIIDEEIFYPGPLFPDLSDVIPHFDISID